MNKTLLELVAKHEGCKLKAYKCPAGAWSIGFGNTYYEDGRKVKEGDTITKTEAERMLYNTLASVRRQVLAVLAVDLPGGAVDALVSFTYNVGIGNLKKSTLLKRVNANPLDLDGIEKEFSRWNKGGGQVLGGLVKRRREEYLMYEEAVLDGFSKRELLYMSPTLGEWLDKKKKDPV